MSAHAYINLEDVPLQLRETAVLLFDDAAGQTFVSFDGCPLAGQSESDEQRQIEYPFPRVPELRNALVEWLIYHGISFTVVV